MPKTTSILDENSWRKHYGALLDELRNLQNIRPTDVAKGLDRLESSTGRNRLPDWSHYIRGDRIPTLTQLSRIASTLKIPETVLRLSTGYVDETLEACHAIAIGSFGSEWSHQVGPRRAALAFLFSLFPSKGMHIDIRCTLLGLMQGTVLRQNTDELEGYQIGTAWNGTWLYPQVFRPEHLIESVFSPDVTYIRVLNVGGDTGLYEEKISASDFVPDVAICAEAQVDAASAIAASIVSCPSKRIPKSCPMFEAQRVLHSRAIPLTMRIDHAADIVHFWADELDKETANEVRVHLQQWNKRTLTSEAACWIRGIEPNQPDEIWL